MYSVCLQDEVEQYGVDWGGPVPHGDTDEMICVPETSNPLSRVDMEELQLISASPLGATVNYGIDLYERALLFVSESWVYTLTVMLLFVRFVTYNNTAKLVTS